MAKSNNSPPQLPPMDFDTGSDIIPYLSGDGGKEKNNNDDDDDRDDIASLGFSRPVSPVSSITSSQMDDVSSLGPVSPPVSPHNHQRIFNRLHYTGSAEADRKPPGLNIGGLGGDIGLLNRSSSGSPWTNKKKNGVLAEEGFNRPRSTTSSTKKSVQSTVYEEMRKEMEVEEIRRLGLEKLGSIDITLPISSEIPFSIPDCSKYNFKWALTPTIEHPRATNSLSTLSIIGSYRVDDNPSAWSNRERKLILRALLNNNLVPTLLPENRTRRTNEGWNPLVLASTTAATTEDTKSQDEEAERESKLKHWQRNIVDVDLATRLVGKLVRRTYEGAKDHVDHVWHSGKQIVSSPPMSEYGGDSTSTLGGVGGYLSISRKNSGKTKRATIMNTLYKSKSDSNLLWKARGQRSSEEESTAATAIVPMRGRVVSDGAESRGSPGQSPSPPPPSIVFTGPSTSSGSSSGTATPTPPIMEEKEEAGYHFLGITKADLLSLLSAKQSKSDEIRRQHRICSERLANLTSFVKSIEVTEPYMRVNLSYLEEQEKHVKSLITHGHASTVTLHREAETELKAILKKKRVVKEILRMTELEFAELKRELEQTLAEYEKLQKSLAAMQGKLGRLQDMWLTRGLVHAVGKGVGHLQNLPYGGGGSSSSK